MPTHRVLVIDDEALIRDLLQEVFEESGFEVAVAGNGAAGLRVCHAQRVDLVVTDLFMPDQDGLETIRMLRRHFPDLPIIALSGGAATDPTDNLRVAKLLGARRTFGKPVDLDALVAAARELVSPKGKGG